MLAGVQPIYGLYASVIPLVLYAFFASSSKLSIGPVAISALLLFSGISALAEPGTGEYLSLIIFAGLLIGSLQIVLGLFRLGHLINFVSHPVIAGFTSAAAIIIIITQLGDALGIEVMRSAHIVQVLEDVISKVASCNYPTLLLFCLTLIFLILIKKLNKNIPGPLIVVLLAIFACYYFDLSNIYELAIVGDIPQGIPQLALPDFNLHKVKLLAPTILTVTVIGIVESLGIARAMERIHKDHKLDPNKELIALGISKIGGSLTQAIPTSGSFSRSAINSSMGAKTSLAGIFTALIIVLTLLFLTPFFYYLPNAVLAAIIIISVIKLFDIKEAKHLYKTNSADLKLMLITFITTLLLGIEIGVLIGVILSLLAVIYKTSKPNMVKLGLLEGTNVYKDQDRHSVISPQDDILVIRFDAPLFFGNTNYFIKTLEAMIEEHQVTPKFVIVDSSLIHEIDSSGMYMLAELDKDLTNQKIELHLCGVTGPVRDQLHLSGLLKESEKHHLSVGNAIENICNSSRHLNVRNYPPMQTNDQ